MAVVALGVVAFDGGAAGVALAVVVVVVVAFDDSAAGVALAVVVVVAFDDSLAVVVVVVVFDDSGAAGTALVDDSVAGVAFAFACVAAAAGVVATSAQSFPDIGQDLEGYDLLSVAGPMGTWIVSSTTTASVEGMKCIVAGQDYDSEAGTVIDLQVLKGMAGSKADSKAQR